MSEEASDPQEIKLRLKWRKTWDDRENDFVGRDPVSGETIGRIYIWGAGGSNNGQWVWFYQAAMHGLAWTKIQRDGFEPTARQAAKAIEDAWFRAIEGKKYDPATKRYVADPAADETE